MPENNNDEILGKIEDSKNIELLDANKRAADIKYTESKYKISLLDEELKRLQQIKNITEKTIELQSKSKKNTDRKANELAVEKALKAQSIVLSEIEKKSLKLRAGTTDYYNTINSKIKTHIDAQKIEIANAKTLLAVQAATLKTASNKYNTAVAAKKEIANSQRTSSTTSKETLQQKALQGKIAKMESASSIALTASGLEKNSSAGYKAILDKKAAVEMYNKTNPETQMKAPSGAAIGAALGFSVASNVVNGAIRSVSQSMSGLNGVLNTVADVVGAAADKLGDMASVAGSMGGVAGAIVGGAASVALKVVGPALKLATQAYMINMNAEIQSRAFGVQHGKLQGFAGGFSNRGPVDVMQKNLSMQDVAATQNSANSIGQSLDSKKKLEEYAVNLKVWGETGISVFRDIAVASDDFSDSVIRTSQVMQNAAPVARSFGISQEAAGQQMAHAGVQARLAGTDSEIAMAQYKSLADESTKKTYMGMGYDVTKEGGSMIGKMAGLGRTESREIQYYLGRKYGQDKSKDPYDVTYKMRNGENSDVKYDSTTGVFKQTGKADGGFYAAQSAHLALSDFANNLKKQNPKMSDKSLLERTRQFGMDVLQFSPEATDILMGKDWRSKEGLAAAKNIPPMDKALEYLKRLDSIDQNIQLFISGKVRDINLGGSYSFMQWIAEQVGGLPGYTEKVGPATGGDMSEDAKKLFDEGNNSTNGKNKKSEDNKTFTAIDGLKILLEAPLVPFEGAYHLGKSLLGNSQAEASQDRERERLKAKYLNKKPETSMNYPDPKTTGGPPTSASHKPIQGKYVNSSMGTGGTVNLTFQYPAAVLLEQLHYLGKA